MRSTAIPLLILAAISLTPTRIGAASITYDVVNYPALQNGYTISGTITTNGATGTMLPATDITSWDITISLGTATLTNINTTNSRNGGHQFDATSSEITILNVGGDIEFFHVSSPQADMGWLNLGTNGVGAYASTVDNQLRWSSVFDTNNLAVAIVPEPSSAVIAVSGAVAAFLAYGWSRHRRAQRRQAAA